MSRKTRKLIWSVPLVATLAIVGALALFMALQPNQAAAQTEEEVPGAPTNAQTRALDQTTIELKWDAPSNDAGGVPDGYRIDYSADGIVWYSLVPNQSGTKYVDNKDLEASETRHYRVFAFNTAGTSRMLGPVEEATTPSVAPDAPTALVVTHGDAATMYADKEHLIVAWTPPVDPPGAPVTSYRIRVSKNNSSFNELEKELKVKDASCSGSDAARRCQYTHKGLFESTERWYHIYAMNSVDESPVSETRSGMTAKGAIPHAPQNLRVGVTTAGEMRLYWDRPVTPPAVVGATHNPPGAPITGYYIVGGPVASGDTVVEVNAGLLFKKPNDDLTALEDGVNIAVNAEAPSLDHVVFHSQGTERALNTGGELATLAKLAGRPSPRHEPDALRTHWGFQVMAVNRVVDRNVQNGRKIEVAADTAGGVDGNWSSSIRVDDTANQTGMLARPTLRTERHADSNNGRTGIKLDWEVANFVDATEYRVEYSEDRIDWKVLTGLDAAVFAGFDPDDGEFTPEIAVLVVAESGVHQGIVAGTGYNYRVFAEQPAVVGAPADRILTQSSAAHRETTATPDRPDSPVLGDPEAVSETELKMTVIVEETATPNEDPPVVGAESGDADVGFGKLVGYRIEISDDGRDWSKYKPVEIGPKRDVRYSYSEKDQKVTETKVTPAEEDRVQFRYTGLHQKATRHFRASTINNAPGTLKYSVATDPEMGTTNESAASDDPGGLVAKAQGRNNIELVWYARGDHITAAPVTGYKIESSPLNDKNECAETWTTLVENTMSTTTAHPHPDLMPGDGFCYRVFGINVVDVSTSFIGFGDDYASTYDADAQAMTDPTVVPGMPMNVTAMATSDTAITVEWEAPADNGGADITGYVLQRAYKDADDTMTDFMTIAATDAATWWNMLDCPMMNAAIPDDATPAPPADDADTDSPYCAMYDGLAVDAKEEVDAVFAANYGTITDTSYMDTGLMLETAYYYRVAAMNSAGMGEYSDGMDMATTGAPNMAPTAGAAIADQTVTAGRSVMVQSTITDADTDDTLTWSAMSNMPTYATAEVDNMGMVTITGVAEGMATITVTATDSMGAMATQEIMVTVEAAEPEEVGPATGVTTGPFNEGGVIQVNWDAAPNATGYIIYAVNVDELDDSDGQIVVAAVNDAAAETFNLGGLNSGDTYDIYVVATAKEMVAWPADAGVVQVEAE